MKGAPFHRVQDLSLFLLSEYWGIWSISIYVWSSDTSRTNAQEPYYKYFYFMLKYCFLCIVLENGRYLPLENGSDNLSSVLRIFLAEKEKPIKRSWFYMSYTLLVGGHNCIIAGDFIKKGGGYCRTKCILYISRIVYITYITYIIYIIYIMCIAYVIYMIYTI